MMLRFMPEGKLHSFSIRFEADGITFEEPSDNMFSFNSPAGACPECDYIKGIPPAIAIEQKVTTRNPRSTVGTSTEIYEYLRLLFARVGKTISPVSGTEVKRHTTEDVVQCATSHADGTKFLVLCPIRVPEGRSLEQQLDIYHQSGFARLEYKGEVCRIDEFDSQQADAGLLYLVIDRLAVSHEKDAISRLTDSAETAF